MKLLRVTLALAVLCSGWTAPSWAAQKTDPVAVKEVKPEYPADALKERKDGSVFVAIKVAPDGTVSDAKIKKGLSPKLDAAALKAAKQWRFKPATEDGKPVAVDTELEMTFTTRP